MGKKINTIKRSFLYANRTVGRFVRNYYYAFVNRGGQTVFFGYIKTGVGEV